MVKLASLMVTLNMKYDVGVGVPADMNFRNDQSISFYMFYDVISQLFVLVFTSLFLGRGGTDTKRRP